MTRNVIIHGYGYGYEIAVTGVAEWEPRSTGCVSGTRILDRGSGGVLAFLLLACRRPRSLLLPALSFGSRLSVAWQLAAVAHRYGRETAACGVAFFSLITRYVALPCLLALLCFACVLARTLAWLEGAGTVLA